MAPHGNEKVAFGATVEPVPAHDASTNNVFDTPKSLSPVQTRNDTSSSNKNPFYSTSSAQPSEQSFSEALKTPKVAVYDVDLEAGRGDATPMGSQIDLSTTLQVPTHGSGYKQSFDSRRTQPCTVWPTKETLREQDRMEKTKKREKKWYACAGIRETWGDMSKKQRLWFKIFVALLIVAIAVGVGIGITRAVHGGVFSGEGQQKQIPQSS